MEIVKIDPNEKVQELRKVPCEVYSRIVGYLRPISDWNLGRRQEWEDRVPYKLEKLGISLDQVPKCQG